MSASISYIRDYLRGPSPDEQYVRRRVQEELVGFCSDERIRRAQDMAANSFNVRGLSITDCIGRAVKWAICAIDPNDPQPPQRAA